MDSNKEIKLLLRSGGYFAHLTKVSLLSIVAEVSLVLFRVGQKIHI